MSKQKEKLVTISLAKPKCVDLSSNIIFWPLRLQRFQGLRHSKRLQQLKKILKRQEKQLSITINDFRALLTEQRTKLLSVIKEKKPDSIYSLAKILARDFKSVKQDINILNKFDLIKLEKTTKNNRQCLKPLLAIDKLNVVIEI